MQTTQLGLGMQNFQVMIFKQIHTDREIKPFKDLTPNKIKTLIKKIMIYSN